MILISWTKNVCILYRVLLSWQCYVLCRCLPNILEFLSHQYLKPYHQLFRVILSFQYCILFYRQILLKGYVFPSLVSYFFHPKCNENFFICLLFSPLDRMVFCIWWGKYLEVTRQVQQLLAFWVSYSSLLCSVFLLEYGFWFPRQPNDWRGMDNGTRGVYREIFGT